MTIIPLGGIISSTCKENKGSRTYQNNVVIIMCISDIFKGNTKFWEILKIGWIVIIYNYDIFGFPCECILTTKKFSP